MRGDQVTRARSSIFLDAYAPTSTAGGLGGCASATPGSAAISITTATLRRRLMTYFDFGDATAHAPDETFLIKTHVLAASLFAAIVAPAAAQDGPSATARPAWVEAGVPETVWVLVESALAESDKDRTKTMLKEAEVQARSAIV